MVRQLHSLSYSCRKERGPNCEISAKLDLLIVGVYFGGIFEGRDICTGNDKIRICILCWHFFTNFLLPLEVALNVLNIAK